MFVLLIVQPALIEWASGRDLTHFDQTLHLDSDLSPGVTRAGRALTLLMLCAAGASCLAWFTSKRRAQSRRPRPHRRRRRTASAKSITARSGTAEQTPSTAGRRAARRLAAMFLPVHRLLIWALAFALICNVLPHLVGLDPQLPLHVLYGPVLILALYAGRRLPHRGMLEAAQWSIAATLIAGLLLHPFIPAATASPAGFEQRVPFLDTRFWGLGSGPNSVAPLALVQLLLQIHQRPRPSILWGVANLIAASAAITVLVWAQSQTAWAAALLVLPFLLIRRSLDETIGRTALQAHHVVFGLLGLAIGLAFIGGELIRSGAIQAIADLIPGAHSPVWKSGTLDAATAIGDQVMTGRGQIWAVALDVWRDAPWTGFGGRAWDADFRFYFGLPSALHAHNQWLQALSVSGFIGFAVLSLYLIVLAWFAWKTSGVSRGLTLALFTVIVVRMITEVPLELGYVMSADAVAHLLLLYLLFAYGSRQRKTARAWSARRRPG